MMIIIFSYFITVHINTRITQHSTIKHYYDIVTTTAIFIYYVGFIRIYVVYLFNTGLNETIKNGCPVRTVRF